MNRPGQKDLIETKTKVVVRKLPPSLTQEVFFESLEKKFAGRYTWFSFFQGKAGSRSNGFSKAYINFKSPHDVLEFSQDFYGHAYVTEKGIQYNAIVEYSPFQRIPKPNAKKDSKEGTINKDSDYLEFLSSLESPSENLPSAEVQLERKEAEAAISGNAGDNIIITPLMEYIRIKRASKNSHKNLSSKSRNSSPPSSSSQYYVPVKNSLSRKVVEKSMGKSSDRAERKKKVEELKERKAARDALRDKKSPVLKYREKEPSPLSRISTSEPSSSPQTKPTSGFQLLKRDTSEKQTQNVQQDVEQNVQQHVNPAVQQSVQQNVKQNIEQNVQTNIKKPTEPITRTNETKPNPSSQPHTKPNHPFPTSTVRSHSKPATSASTTPSASAAEAAAAAAVTGLTLPSSKPNLQGSKLPDTRRYTRNRDRPDRPVWTPRHRSDHETNSTPGHNISKPEASRKYPDAGSNPRNFQEVSVANQSAGFSRAAVDSGSGNQVSSESGNRRNVREASNSGQAKKLDKQVWVAVQK